MEELKNLVSSVLAKGFATFDERSEIVAEAEEYTTEELGTLVDDIAVIENLPLEKSVKVGPDENDDDEISRETRADRRAKAREAKGK